MSGHHDDVTYRREHAIGVLRLLEELVVSLDRLASASSEMSPSRFDAALSAFIADHQILAKAAHARRLLSAPFPTEVGPDDMDELERALQDVPCWRPAEMGSDNPFR